MNIPDMQDYIGRWIDDDSVIPSISEVAETWVLLQIIPEEFTCSEEELIKVVYDKLGIDPDNFYEEMLNYFEKGYTL